MSETKYLYVVTNYKCCGQMTIHVCCGEFKDLSVDKNFCHACVSVISFAFSMLHVVLLLYNV
jgi:hypothetical protein